MKNTTKSLQMYMNCSDLADGAHGGIRTPDLNFRRVSLYPTELHALMLYILS